MAIICILVGSHPKGYDVPFHPKTHSGRILRSILQDSLSSVKLYDLWNDDNETAQGILSRETVRELQGYHASGRTVIALGRTVERTLTRYRIPHRYAPHPSCRRKTDRERLRAVLHEELMKII